MTIDDFIEKFAFAIETEASSLSPETDYKQLPQWDSLNTLALIAMADAEYGITLSGQAINDTRTIADLWTLISSKVKA
ncbi:acyl carrier protein [Dyella lutea]|uniref:Phosphopantetheine-binding protein n=1 Tax=Dyella lutea TaxID=2950441 RepID=A0ABT1F9N1_9GAMM|nr:phosphopantetheine-binding protein [Dyella lutea]MCP1374085.1 phosphopantetheine-binding protein [Dyella lutea]